MIFFDGDFAKMFSRDRPMNEECLLKYLLNPDELEILTEILQSFTKELQPSAE